MGTSQQTVGSVRAPSDDASIQIVRHLQDEAEHSAGRSGDYCVGWDIALAHPAQIPLVVTQHCDWLAEVHHGGSDVICEAAYTEVLGLIPVGQTRPTIAGTPEAIGALLEYARANPASPLVLPSRAELKAFAQGQVNAAESSDRQHVTDYYEAALRAYEPVENSVYDRWYFPGLQIATTGTANVCGRLSLYEATPVIFKVLSAWNTNGVQERFAFGHLQISMNDFNQMFLLAPPLPCMGQGGSDDGLSCSDQDGGVSALDHFKRLGHETAAERLKVTWKDTDRPDFLMQP